jgi:hypothetical protein
MTKVTREELAAQNLQLVRRVNTLTVQLNEARGNPRLPSEDAQYMTTLEDVNARLSVQVEQFQAMVWKLFEACLEGVPRPEFVDADEAMNFLQTYAGEKWVNAFGHMGHRAIQWELEQRSRKIAKEEDNG